MLLDTYNYVYLSSIVFISSMSSMGEPVITIVCLNQNIYPAKLLRWMSLFRLTEYFAIPISKYIFTLGNFTINKHIPRLTDLSRTHKIQLV